MLREDGFDNDALAFQAVLSFSSTSFVRLRNQLRRKVSNILCIELSDNGLCDMYIFWKYSYITCLKVYFWKCWLLTVVIQLSRLNCLYILSVINFVQDVFNVFKVESLLTNGWRANIASVGSAQKVNMHVIRVSALGFLFRDFDFTLLTISNYVCIPIYFSYWRTSSPINLMWEEWNWWSSPGILSVDTAKEGRIPAKRAG